MEKTRDRIWTEMISVMGTIGNLKQRIEDEDKPYSKIERKELRKIKHSLVIKYNRLNKQFHKGDKGLRCQS